MRFRLSHFLVPVALAAAIPTAAVMAQSQSQDQGQRPGRVGRLSADAMTRLQDGRIAMIRESLKLNDAQLKLWEPVEQELRASFASRQQVRAERREQRQQRDAAARLTLPDRLDRASQRMADRAQRLKRLADVVRPLYASLTDEQKAVAGIVLRQGKGFGRFHGRRWAMQRPPRADQK